MEKVEYKDILYLDKINEVKATIHNSGFPIDYEKTIEVDQLIQSLLAILDKCPNEKCLDTYKEIEEKIGKRNNQALCYYYYAIYNGNFLLLKELLKKKINFDDTNIRENLFMLDQNFSKRFQEEDYLYFLKYCKEELYKFYEEVNASTLNSKVQHESKKGLLKEINHLNELLFISNDLDSKEREFVLNRLKEISQELKSHKIDLYKEEEKEKATKIFISLMKQNPRVFKREKKDEYARKIYSSLLSPIVLETFGIEKMLQLNDFQKEIICEINARERKEVERVYDLIERYPNFKSPLKITKELLDCYTNDEIVNMTEEEIKIIEKARIANCIPRVKRLMNNGFSFQNHLELIHPIIMEALNDEEILKLTSRKIQKLKKLILNTSYLATVEKEEFIKECHAIATKNIVFIKGKSRFFE